jgi:hypothetical protein
VTTGQHAVVRCIQATGPGLQTTRHHRRSDDEQTKHKEELIMADAKLKETTFENTKLNVVPLNWKEVYYTNCPLISASNVDQELGWTREEYKKIGVKYDYFRITRENDFYPHYIHNLDNLIRFGGLFPPRQCAR